MATSTLFASWVWLLAIGGAAALPLGGAPLPLDPVLSNIAPEECLWYAAYSGQGPADPESKNETEQLFAEPQVQHFAEEVSAQLMRAIRRAGGPDREKRILTEHVPTLMSAVLTRPFAAYVENVEPKDQGFDGSAAFVLNAGDRRDEMKAAIDELLKLVPPDGPQLATESVGDVEWRRVPTPPEAPAVRFGWKDEYFIIAAGEGTPAKVLRVLGAKSAADAEAPAGPSWLKELRKEHPIERELSVGYLNVEGVLKRFRPIIEANHEGAWPVIEKLGLTHIRVLHGISGYDEAACRSMAHIVTDGERPGLLGMLPHQPLDESDLHVIPKDALLAFAGSVDLAELWDNATKLASEFDAHAQEELGRAMWEIETNLGVNVRDDVVAALDDAWAIYLPGGDLMISWLNAAAAVRVKDSGKLQSAVEKMVDAAQAELARHPEGAAITESALGEHKVYSLQLPTPAPIAPSWCVGKDWLVFSLSPQTIRTVLERKAEDSLAEAPGVREALSAENGVAAIGYQDTPRLVSSLYPWLRIGAQMASGELRKNGIEFDPAILPSDEVIIKHLHPGVTTLSHAKDGFHFDSRHSLPGEGNLAAAAPIGVALLLPAVSSARTAAHEAQDMNSLRQFALAALNHESATGKYPADIYSADGKPQLSWRVKVLPYLEQQALYTQFKLDEPWDSPHNRPLMDQMPDVFRSADAKGETTKTRFVALKGLKTVFTGPTGTDMKHITDGTSNTLLFVQAAPDHAVEWTKPADIDFNPEKPFAGLESPRGIFLAALCDGSVRRISLTIGDEVMKALATRDGGEAIGQESLAAPPGPVRQ